jgi:hypothetical protein
MRGDAETFLLDVCRSVQHICRCWQDAIASSAWSNADSGYWNEEQMDNVVANEHVQVLIAPRRRQARGAAAEVQGGR